MAQKFSEKIPFGSFTAGAVVTFSPQIFSNRDVDFNRPFTDGACVNNTDVDLEVIDPRDIKNPVAILKSSGGSHTFSKSDLLDLNYPYQVKNNTAGAATSGNFFMTLIR